jgi:protein O-GlcNAc transferase
MSAPRTDRAADYMKAGLEQRAQNRLDEATSAFRRAVALEPESAETHYQLGYTLSIKGDLDEAAKHAHRAIELDPEHAEAHNNLGYIALRQGKLEEASTHYRTAVGLKPDYVKAHYNLGLALSLSGRPEEAIPSYRRAIVLDPTFGEAYHNLAMILVQLNRIEEAVACFHKLLAVHPDSVPALQNLGNALAMLGKIQDAADCYRKALTLRPDKAELHRNLGDVLARDQRFDEAVASYGRALSIRPDYAEAEYGLGAALSAQRKLGDAEAAFRRALAIRPDYAEAYCALGLDALLPQRRLEEALGAFQRALEIKPDYAEAHCNIGHVLGRFGLIEEGIAACREAIKHKPDLAQAHSNLCMMLHYPSNVAPEEIFAEHRRFAAHFEKPLTPSWPAHRNARDPERRLRIGYVSADFRLHSVSFFIEPILDHHDKTNFEVICYHSNTTEDEVTARLRARADRWVPCAHLSDAALAERVLADEIDILVDLSGHTGINRLLTFARKPAPVQVTYLGYPATTGLSAMDYRLTTADLDPPGSEQLHTERLFRLPRALWCFRRLWGDAPETAPAPAIRNGFITFGSMNNIFKLSAATIALWARILQAVPRSRLFMTLVPDGRARDLLCERFAAHRIDEERLVSHAHLPADRFRMLSSEIDIALDPFPYNGTTTTCQALSMGIPVVTLIGDTSVSRSGYALLKSSGLNELCAAGQDQYLETAVELATDLDTLERLRSTVRARMDGSPLRDEAGLTRDIEDAYRQMWRDWCGQ